MTMMAKTNRQQLTLPGFEPAMSFDGGRSFGTALMPEAANDPGAISRAVIRAGEDTRLARTRRLVLHCPLEVAEGARQVEARTGRAISYVIDSLLWSLPPEVFAGLGDFNETSPRGQGGAGRIALRVSPQWERQAVRQAILLASGLERSVYSITPAGQVETLTNALARETQRNAQLLDYLERLSFAPLPDGVRSDADALHVLGMPHTSLGDSEALARRFRAIAPVYHPDTGLPNSHGRMVQVLDARRRLMGASRAR